VEQICLLVTPEPFDAINTRLIRVVVESLYKSTFLYTVLVGACVGMWRTAVTGLLYYKTVPVYDELAKMSFWFNIVAGPGGSQPADAVAPVSELDALGMDGGGGCGADGGGGVAHLPDTALYELLFVSPKVQGAVVAAIVCCVPLVYLGKMSVQALAYVWLPRCWLIWAASASGRAVCVCG
jgi:hypothetical protein